MTRSPDRRKAILAAVLLVLLAVLVAIFLQTGFRERIKTSAVSPSPSKEPAPEAEKPMKKVTLFFVQEEDGLLAPEEHQIPAGNSVVEEARETIDELLKGPSTGLISPLPAETKLEQIFVTNDGTAYVDFSKDLVDQHPSGTEAELATVYAVVDSLTYNFKSIKKVFILVEGEERETLGGHIALDHPFLPNYSLIIKG
jgi:spore germination protein GerM